MNTITIGRTTYKLRDTSTIFADHAKCTGKHRKIKPKADKPRQYPLAGAGMSTADYVAQYQSLNHKLMINAWDWQTLTEHVSQAQGEDTFEVEA
jgi:hypothetical protein